MNSHITPLPMVVSRRSIVIAFLADVRNILRFAITDIKYSLFRLGSSKGKLFLGKKVLLGWCASIQVNCNTSSICIGDRCVVHGDLFTFGHGGSIKIGDDCFVGKDSHIWSADRIEIGNRVLISHNVSIFDSLTHPISAQARHSQFLDIVQIGQPQNISLEERPVAIRDDAWIGCNVVVLRGVTIGEGAIVGAGSVVTKDVPDWTMVAGNPAKFVRSISENER